MNKDPRIFEDAKAASRKFAKTKLACTAVTLRYAEGTATREELRQACLAEIKAQEAWRVAHKVAGGILPACSRRSA
jgi:hypothetical protein